MGKMMDKLLEELRQRKSEIREMGGPQKVAKQHGRGKMTARERIDFLFDPGLISRTQGFGKFNATLVWLTGRIQVCTAFAFHPGQTCPGVSVQNGTTSDFFDQAFRAGD